MTYHAARNNRQLGVFEKEDILQRYNAGTIYPTDLVWTEGMATWEPAAKVFGAPIAPDGGGVSAPATPAPYAPPVITGVAVPMESTMPPPVPLPPTLTVPGGVPAKPGNNLVGAILVTLFCCWPLGIPSIVFAAQVDGKYSRGDYAGAADSARKSRLCMWWSIGLSVVFAVIMIGVSVIGAVAKHGGRY